jgi:hypothetical protein
MVGIWWYRLLQLFLLFIIKYYPKGFVPGEDTGAIILTYPCLLELVRKYRENTT